MPFNEFATHRPTSKAYHERKANSWLSLASVSGVLPASVRFHRWTLGFKQFSFNRADRVLRSMDLTTTSINRFPEVLYFPLVFRLISGNSGDPQATMHQTCPR